MVRKDLFKHPGADRLDSAFLQQSRISVAFIKGRLQPWQIISLLGTFCFLHLWREKEEAREVGRYRGHTERAKIKEEKKLCKAASNHFVFFSVWGISAGPQSSCPRWIF